MQLEPLHAVYKCSYKLIKLVNMPEILSQGFGYFVKGFPELL